MESGNYLRKKRARVKAPEGRKFCHDCNTEKDEADFYYMKINDKFSSYCKCCMISRQSKIYQDKKPHYRALRRKSHFKNKYGLSVEDVKTSGQCPICLKEKRLIVDHCHTNGHVRGFICYSCNTVLGHIENKEKFKRYLHYIDNAKFIPKELDDQKK